MKGQLLDPSHVVRGRPVVVTAGQFGLVELGQHAQAAGFGQQEIVFGLGPVAVENLVWLAKLPAFPDPRRKRRVVNRAAAQPAGSRLEQEAVRGGSTHQEQTEKFGRLALSH